jgi:hypothetical protein
MRLADLRWPRSLLTAACIAMFIGLAGPAAAAPTPPTWPTNPQPIAEPAAAAPAWPANPQPLARPAASVHASSSGFDWGAAGIGAGSVAVLAGVALGSIAVVLRRRRKPQSPSFAP